MSTKVGDIFVRANLDDKDYKKSLNGLGNVTSSVGKKLTKALTLTAVVGGLTAVINKVGTLGDTIDKTSQKLGMSAKAYQEWDFIMRRNGSTIEGMTMAMRTLATSVETGKDALKELGISQEEALGLSQEQLFERVVKALQGVESTTRRTYLAGQLLGRGSTELGAVLNLTAEDMDNLKNRVASLGGVMSDTAVKNSAQFKDALNDVKFAFRGIGNTIAEYVLPLITSAVNNVIIPAIVSIANAIRSLFAMLSKIGGVIGKGVSAVKSIFNKASQKDINKTSNAIGNVGSGLGKAGKNAGKAKKQVQALKRELLGFDKITKLTKQDASTGTSGGSGAGGGGGLDLSGYGAEDLEALTESTSLLSNINIPPALLEALQHLREALGGLFDVLKSAGAWVLENVLKPLGKWLVEEIAPPVINALASAIEILTNVLKILGTVLEPLWNYVVKPFFEYLGEGAKFGVELLAKGMEILSTVTEKVKDAIVTAHDKLAGFVEKWDSIKEAGKNITLGIVDKFSDKWKKIKDSWEGIKKKFAGKTATVTLTLKNGFSKAWNKVKKAWNGIKSKTAEIKLKFTEAIKTKWNAIARKVNQARANSALARTLIPSNMPYLAQGGYVERNTPQLAVIGDNKHEGEIVAPESKLRAMVQEVANQNNNTEVVRLLSALLVAVQTKDNNVYLDGEQIKNNVVRRINNHTRATGQLELIV